MKIIKSLELLLYELMVWFVFYPRTLWLAVTAPLKLMDYADDELDDEDDDRYSDTLSPPIFLAITLGLIHMIELAASLNVQSEGVLADDKNLLAFRIVAFSLFPLMLSLRMLRAQGVTLDRKTLRGPFYAQCFIVVPFALLIDVASLFLAAGTLLSLAAGLLVVAGSWYLVVQTLWFRQVLGRGWLGALGHAVRALATALFLLIVFGLVVASM